MRKENENKILIETREEKDIGVWITNDLKHEKQVIAASHRAMTVLRSVKRAFVRFDILYKRSVLFTQRIRPHLKYYIQAWAPYYAKDILLLVWGLKDLSYEERVYYFIQPRRTEITWVKFLTSVQLGVEVTKK